MEYIRDIEKLIKKKIEIVSNNPFPQTDKPMTISEKKELEKHKQKIKRDFFANRNKKKHSRKRKNRKIRM